MASLEIITLRVGKDLEVGLLRKLAGVLNNQILLKEKVRDLRFFERTKGTVEMAIALFWSEGNCGLKGSQLGERLFAALEEFGSVSHTVWEEFTAPEGDAQTMGNE